MPVLKRPRLASGTFFQWGSFRFWLLKSVSKCTSPFEFSLCLIGKRTSLSDLQEDFQGASPSVEAVEFSTRADYFCRPVPAFPTRPVIGVVFKLVNVLGLTWTQSHCNRRLRLSSNLFILFLSSIGLMAEISGGYQQSTGVIC